MNFIVINQLYLLLIFCFYKVLVYYELYYDKSHIFSVNFLFFSFFIKFLPSTQGISIRKDKQIFIILKNLNFNKNLKQIIFLINCFVFIKFY